MQALTAERFSETFFRPTKKLHHPEKNALPEEKPEDVKFVQILTEKPSVESSRSSGASRANSVVLPARVSQTTPKPAKTPAQRREERPQAHSNRIRIPFLLKYDAVCQRIF